MPVFFCLRTSNMNTSLTPISLDQVADHLERLLLRYEELQKSNVLLQTQLQDAVHERDSLRLRLSAARTRVDALLARLPGNDTGTVVVRPEDPAVTGTQEALPVVSVAPSSAPASGEEMA